MDYDDNEFQGQNCQLAGEGCSKVSPVLPSYPLPKFDFDDTLNEHLSFNSLVKNEVFLGQEDNQWIEEYSRGSSGVEFNSSGVETTHNNVWSEATSSESVEMLLNSVGQEEKDEGKAVIQQLDPNITNETVSLTKAMDPNLNQESDISVLEEKVDNTFDDVILKEPKKDHPGSSENAISLSENVSSDATKESVQIKEKRTNAPMDRDTMIVESYTKNVEYADHPSAKTSNPFSEKPPAGSSISHSESASQLIKLKDSNFPKSDAGSLSKMSPIKISSIEENETDTEKDAKQIISDTSMVSASNLPETGCESSPMQVGSKIISSEPGAVHLDQDDSLYEKDTSLPLESNDMDIEVLRALDSQKNVDTENNVTASICESDVSARVEGVAVYDQRSSPDTDTTENNERPKSPILGVSFVHQGSKESKEVGCSSEGNSQNEFSRAESVVASDSKNPSALVGKETPLDLAEKVHQIDAHNVPPIESCNAIQVEQEPGTKNGSQDCVQDPKESMIEVKKSNEHQRFVDVARPSDEVSHGTSSPSKTADDVENKVRSVSLGNATPEEKNLNFEVNKRADLGQDGKGSISYPTFKVTDLPKIKEGSSKDSSSNQMDPKKFPEVSVTPQTPSGLTSQIGVKGKSQRKPRRKSVGKENAKKGMLLARDPVRGEMTPVLLTPPATSQVTRFEDVKSNENITKPGVVLSSSKIPDLNNSASMFQQPFTDNQQLQLRAQILVYGSLISGSPPEESHMIAAFGQSDGVRIWEGVWRACLERIHIQKSQPKSSTPIQSRSDMRDAGSRSDQVIKQASVQNKIPSSPIVGPNNKGGPPFISPTIPFSSPLWRPTILSDNLQSSAIAKAARFDFHQTLSPLRPTYQTPPVPNYNSSWLNQSPFSGQWLAASPIPTLNPTPHFSSLPISDVKLTPVKESGGSMVKHTSNPPVLNSSPIIFPEVSSLSGIKRSTVSSDQPASESKSRKKKKGIIPIVGIPCSPPVEVSMPAFMTPKTNPTHHTKSGDQNMEKVVISEERLTKVEESKLQAKEATEHADNAMFHCNGVWSQVERRYSNNLNSNDEAKLISSAVSIAAAASVAKVAAAAAKIASNVAEQARLMVNSLNKSQNLASAPSKHAENLDAIVKAAELAAEAVSQAGKIVAMSEPFSLKDLVEGGPEGYWKTPRLASKQQTFISENLNVVEKRNVETAPDIGFEVLETIGAVPELENRSTDTSIVGQPELKVPSGDTKESDIKEGCLVEVYKNDDTHKGAWFGANVLSLKDEKAYVSYTGIQSDEGSEKLKEWIPLEVENTEVPKIRLAHPVTTLQGTRKRRRTAATDFLWSSGDRVDVWMQNHWHEGVVIEANKLDATSLTVKFPEGETLVVRSWFVRPPLIWKDGKWIMCQTSEKHLSSPSDTPQEKRSKLGSPTPIMDSKRKPGSSENIDPRKQEETRPLSLSTQESKFNIGSTTHKTMRSGLQKVTFGVPKPGKKQKFMDVSKHYVADGSKHDSIKFTRYLIPHPPGSRGWKNNSHKEKHAAETKSQMFKSRKPPVPSVRTLSTTNKNSLDSVSDGENQQVQMEHGPSSSIEKRLNKRKFAPTKVAKVEKPVPEVGEPRRSNRKIQPTSRLLEGLQSSMSISKIPAVSHSTQRKVTLIQKETGTTEKGKENS